MNDVSRIRPARFPADRVAPPTERRKNEEGEEKAEPDDERRTDRVELETTADRDEPAPREKTDDDDSSEEGSRIDVVA